MSGWRTKPTHEWTAEDYTQHWDETPLPETYEETLKLLLRYALQRAGRDHDDIALTLTADQCGAGLSVEEVRDKLRSLEKNAASVKGRYYWLKRCIERIAKEHNLDLNEP